MSTGNPYAAPAASSVYRVDVNVPPGASARAPVGPLLNRLRLVFGTAHVIVGAVAVGGMVAGAVARNMELLRNSSFGVWASLAFFFAWALVDILWVHRFWSWIPPEHRYTSMWPRYISPGTVCGLLFVPLFSFYWMIVLYLGYDEILDRLQVEVPCSRPPAKTLAILTILSFLVFWPAAPLVSYLLARRLEETANEIHWRRTATVARATASQVPIG